MNHVSSRRATKSVAVLLFGLAATLFCIDVSTSHAERDHLKAYQTKDLNKIPVPSAPVTVQDEFGSETCELKKAQLFLVQSEKNAENDPRGSPPGNFICYKAKCSGEIPPVTISDSQLGIHALQSKQAKLVCLPLNAGSGGGTCPVSGGIGLACMEFGTAASTCEGCCNADTACFGACTAAKTAACSNGPLNDTCNNAMNDAGCDAVCCF